MILRVLSAILLCFAWMHGPAAVAQDHTANGSVTFRILAEQAGHTRIVSAVAWLKPQAGAPALLFPPHEHYSLLQKNRTFIPHLQVIPVGSSVQFPNKDPFFHNVFSLFDGKRFDLGLYEAGSSKAVTFSREGPSYIFCNIHPEMSAVIVALSTPLYAIASDQNRLEIRNIPPGSYQLHFWIEGVQQKTLDTMVREVEITATPINLDDVHVSIPAAIRHDNMFGQPYDKTSPSQY